MTEARLVLRLLDRDFLFRLILALLAYSLIPLGEILLFIYLADVVGNYLILVLAVLVGLPGVLIIAGKTRRTLDHLREKIRGNEYPAEELGDLVGILIGGLLLLTPGFATDLFGYLLLVPFVRVRLARAVVRKLDPRLREIFGRLKLAPTA